MVDNDYGYLTYSSINNLVQLTGASKSSDQQSTIAVVSAISRSGLDTVHMLNIMVRTTETGTQAIVAAITTSATTLLQSLANPNGLNNPTSVQDPNNSVEAWLASMGNSRERATELYNKSADNTLSNSIKDQTPKNDAKKLAPYMKDYSPPEGRLGEFFGNAAEKMFKSVSFFGKNMVAPAPNATGKTSGIGGAMMGAVAGLGAMIPQMMALAIVTQPLRAFLEGIMSPFEVISELFGAFGEVLGTAFIPVIVEIVNAVVPFLPIVAGLAQILAPLILLAFKFLTPLGLLMTIFQVLAQFVPPDIAKMFTDMPQTIANGMSGVGAAIMGWVNGLPAVIAGGLVTVGNSIGYWFTVTLPNFFTDGVRQIGETINKTWEDIGTNLTGGGADKKGWW